MGIIERKERERSEMRLQILDAARKLFLEQGFEKTSIRNIAEVIEYSPATIYLYYKDKNELLFALHQEAFQKLFAEMQSVATIQDPFERLYQLGKKYLNFATQNPELYDLMFVMRAPMEALECRAEIWDDGKDAFGILKMVVAECMKVGYFSGGNVDDVSLSIWASVHGLATIWLRNRMAIFPEDEWQTRFDAAYDYTMKLLKNTK